MHPVKAGKIRCIQVILPSLHKGVREQRFSSSWQYVPGVHRRPLYFAEKQTLKNEGGEGSPSLNIKNFRIEKMNYFISCIEYIDQKME